MPGHLKATNEQLTAAYRELGNVWKVAERFAMCGQSVHERLTKLGVAVPRNVFTDADDERLRREYLLYRDAGQLAKLAESMGRDKTTICGRAKTLGLTNKSHERRYSATWKYITEETAAVIFEDFKRSPLTLGRYCNKHGHDDLGFSRTMQKFFPAEYEAAIELKAPKQTMYRLGRSFEYRMRDELKKIGYFVMRSAGSKSPIDLLAVKHGSVLMVQCKRGGGLGVKDWNELFDLAQSVGAIPVMAETPQARTWRFWRLVGRKDGSKRAQPMETFQP